MDTDEKLVKEMVLASVGKCSVCGHHYGVEEIEVVGRQDECWFLSMVCEECRSQGLVAAMVGRNGPVEIVTDIDEDEPVELEPLTIEDVLEMHRFLAGFDADFKSLFAGDFE
jgi:hypothetical protein